MLCARTGAFAPYLCAKICLLYTSTINRYVKRGTLDADLAEVMKKLAKDKMLRALSNVAYAKGAYEKEMDQAALKKEASAKIYKERVKHE